jgi:hypothetical protein
MMGSKMLLTAYQYSYFLVTEAIKDLDQQESLLKPPGGDNPANWILGHILTSRSNIQAMLGLEPIWNKDRCTPYLPDSDPLTSQSQVEDFKVMVADLTATQEALVMSLEELTDVQLAEISGENNLGENLTGYAIHEAYHAGELAMIGKWLQNSRFD